MGSSFVYQVTKKTQVGKLEFAEGCEAIGFEGWVGLVDVGSIQPNQTWKPGNLAIPPSHLADPAGSSWRHWITLDHPGSPYHGNQW